MYTECKILENYNTPSAVSRICHKNSIGVWEQPLRGVLSEHQPTLGYFALARAILELLILTPCHEGSSEVCRVA